MCEETEWQDNFGDSEQFDLIINNMSLHWLNDVEQSLNNFLQSLVPDGAFIAASLGGETLQEFRICMNLAEQERQGGVSPICSPFLSVTDLGNIFARCKYNLPTIDVQHAQMEFTSTFALMSFLSLIGEQNALTQTKEGIRSVDSLIAGAAIFETLFNRRTIGQRDEETETSVLIDTLQDEYLFDKALDLNKMKQNNEYLQMKLRDT